MIEPLIPLAFEFRQAEPWLLLADNDIYAVQLRDGRVGYCSVMGNAGSHYALGLYIGRTGWNSYLNICSMADCDTDADMAQIAYRLDCINCDYMDQREIQPSKVKDAVMKYASERGFRLTGNAALPDFTRHSPCHMPWIITNQSDADAMEDALRASAFLANYLNRNSMESAGFSDDGIHPSDIGGQRIPFLVPNGKTWKIQSTSLPGRTPATYPTPIFNHPEISIRIATLKPFSNIECRQLVIGAPVMETEVPCLPVLLMAVDGNDGHVTITEAAPDSPNLPEDQILDLSLKILNLGYRPTKIFVQDERTQALLKDFCTKTGIPMQKVSRLKHLQEAWEFLSQHLSTRNNLS